MFVYHALRMNGAPMSKERFPFRSEAQPSQSSHWHPIFFSPNNSCSRCHLVPRADRCKHCPVERRTVPGCRILAGQSPPPRPLRFVWGRLVIEHDNAFLWRAFCCPCQRRAHCSRALLRARRRLGDQAVAARADVFFFAALLLLAMVALAWLTKILASCV